MLLKIKLNTSRLLKADEQEITIEMNREDEPIILTTHYLEGKPDIVKARLFVSLHERIQKA